MPSGEAQAGHRRLAVAASFVFLSVLQASLMWGRLRKSPAPVNWDQSVHMESAWKYRQDMADGRWSGLLHPPYMPGNGPYPPLAHVVMAFCMRLTGPLGLTVESAAAFSGFFFLMLLSWAAYLIASDAWGEEAGIAAAFLAGLLPPFQSLAGQTMTDIFLTGWVAMAYALWIKSRRFTFWKESLLLGAVTGAGLLTKWSFFTYVLPILADAAWVIVRRPKEPEARRAAVALLAGAVLAAPWYGANLWLVPCRIARNIHNGFQEGDPTHGWAAWTYYAVVFKQEIGWIGLAAAVAGFAWACFRSLRSAGLLAAWVGSSYVAWSIVANKDPRYMLPALVVPALAAAALPSRLPVVLAVLLTGGALTTYRRLPMGAPEAWPLRPILDRAVSLREDPSGPPAVITLLANTPFLNGNTMRWTALREGWDGALLVRTRSPGLGMFSEFVLVKTGDIGPGRSGEAYEGPRREALRPDGWFEKSFSRAGEWPLPDGGTATLFHRLSVSSASAVDVDPAAVLFRLAPGMRAEGLKVSCSDGPPFKGEMSCRAEAADVRLKGLGLQDVRLSMSGLRLAVDDEGAPRVMDLKRIDVASLRLAESDAARFLSVRIKALRNPVVHFLAGNELEMSGRLVVPVAARLRLSYDPLGDKVGAEVLVLRVAGLPLPARFLFPKALEASLRPGRGWPCVVKLAGLKTVPASAGAEGVIEAAR